MVWICHFYCRKSFLGDKNERGEHWDGEKKHFIKDENVGDACDKKLMFGILSTLLNAHYSAGEEPDHGDQDKAHPHPGLDCACAAR